MKTRTYSREKLICLLKEWVQKNGFVPSKRQLNEDVNMPSDMAYRKTFGSWGSALAECGYEIKKPYPSEKCLQAVSDAKKGKQSSNWKGGEFVSKDGYVMIWNAETQKYDREHRLIIEKQIGRKLKKYEDVHHINGIKNDNRIENLEVLSRSEHASLHEETQGKLKHQRANKERCSYPNCNEYTSSKYKLCRKHYKSQWGKLQKGTIKSIDDFTVTERKCADETKEKLSRIAKEQPRKNGKFSN